MEIQLTLDRPIITHNMVTAFYSTTITSSTLFFFFLFFFLGISLATRRQVSCGPSLDHGVENGVEISRPSTLSQTGS
jgi:hypothetical protein